jgi:hypothetical protein
VLRLAGDEALVVGVGEIVVDDPHAVLEPDAGFVSISLDPDRAAAFLAAHCDWEPPSAGLGQGLVAGIPAKVLRQPERVLLIVPAPFAHELSALLP